ncbi:alpha/beta fold hydrolase [Nocardioides sp. SYSU D00038]|uniref:alpha/beta fold hydrolase n=1 Tax=Nocardioides sp. SYSU D00038 TaxID=2812554 RepID=UPI0019682BB4|nr:alpha/beta fold hydrolase [Nocardioides sp. SYSU D00038]
MDASPLGQFLLPEGFARPRLGDVVKEAAVVAEGARFASRLVAERRAERATAYTGRSLRRAGDPVILVPGFLAGDLTLTMMSRVLRRHGFRTYTSHIHANVGCTLNAAAQLESRIESIAIKRGGRVQVVGHSLGGLLARGLAVRRPDLISGIVTLGSPMLAPGAHHPVLTTAVEVLVRLSRAGLPGMMSEECVGGSCARQSFDESRAPVPAGTGFTAIWSRNDGIVDWRACIDPEAHAVEVSTSHVGMALDPRVVDEVIAALTRHAAGARLGAVPAGSALEVDRGESA